MTVSLSPSSVTHTGDGVTVRFDTGWPLTSPQDIIAVVGGAFQIQGAYAVDGSVVVYNEAPPAGVIIEHRIVAQASVTQSSLEGFIVTVSDESTVLTTGATKLTFRMPYAFALAEVRASLSTASTSGAVTVTIKEGGVSLFGTNKLTIAQGSKTSVGGIAPTLSDTSLANDAEITVDIDGAGTGAKGLKIALIGTPGTSAPVIPTIPTTDPLWSNVPLLLQPTSTDTVPLDYSGKGIAKTVTNTGVTFSGGRGVFNGAASLSVAMGADAQFPGDFDLRANFVVTTAAPAYQGILDTRTSSPGTGVVILMVGGNVCCYCGGTLVGSFAVSLNTSYEARAVRTGTAIKFLVSGTQIGTITSSTNYTDGACIVGNTFDNYKLSGNVWDVQIIKGRALVSGAYAVGAVASTPDTVLRLALSTNALDDATGRGKVLTKTGGVSVSASGAFAGMGSFAFTSAGLIATRALADLAAFIHRGDERCGRRGEMLIVRLQARASSAAALMAA